MSDEVPSLLVVSESESKLCPDRAPEIYPQSPQVVFSPLEPVHQEDSLEEIQRKDLSLTNDVIGALYASWGTVRSISGVCLLASMTFKAMEHRRKVLNQPYGEANASYKGKVLPI